MDSMAHRTNHTVNDTLYRAFMVSVLICIMPLGVKGQEIFERMFIVDKSHNAILHRPYNEKIDSIFILPDTIYAYGDTIPLKSIDLTAFANRDDLKSITLPKHLEEIGFEAFARCDSLKSISIPAEVRTIDNSAFDMANLQFAAVATNNPYFDSRDNCNAIINSSSNTLVVGTASTIIPPSVLEIGVNAFSGRKSLKQIIIPHSVSVIKRGAFAGCTSLASVCFDKAPVKSIGQGAFWGCSNLRNITLPSTLREIDVAAFSSCSKLQTVFIPSNVDFIGEAAFSGCSNLCEIIVDPHCTWYDSRNNCNAIIEKKTKTLVAGCKTTTIPNGVKIIGKSAFKDIDEFEHIDIPEGVTLIDENAFSGCKNLKSLVLPKSLEELHITCIAGCDKLKYIIVCSKKPPLIDSADPAFCNITLYVPKGCAERYKKTDWKTFGEIIEIGKNPALSPRP